jgi:hypothetical protein
MPANFEINPTNCTSVPKSASFAPVNGMSITFHSSAATTLDFQPSTNCFGQASLALGAGGAPTPLQVKSFTATSFTISGCPAKQGKKTADDTYDITFNQPKKKK